MIDRVDRAVRWSLDRQERLARTRHKGIGWAVAALPVMLAGVLLDDAGGPVGVVAGVVVGVFAGLGVAAGFRARSAWSSGWYRRTVHMCATWEEARARGMRAEEWLLAELERDLVEMSGRGGPSS